MKNERDKPAEHLDIYRRKKQTVRKLEKSFIPSLMLL